MSSLHLLRNKQYYFYHLASLVSPKLSYQLAGYIWPWIAVFGSVLLLYGVIAGLFFAPADYQQGDGFRMIYIHVPAAFLSLGIYSFMGFCSVVYLIWRIKVADFCAEASAGIGATYTLIALISGALWGKPMWGTWWIWDARLTSELVLFFLYCGYLGLRSAIRNRERSSKAAAILAIAGIIDIPIVHFSVEWWATLHQGATLAKWSKPSIAPEMLYPLLAMIAGFGCFYGVILCIRLRTHLLKRTGA